MWDLISGYIRTGVDIVKGIWTVFTDLLTGNWSGAWNTIKALPGKILGDVAGSISGAVGAITNAIGQITGAIWNGVKTTFDNVLNLFKNLGSDIVNAIAGIATQLFWAGMNIVQSIVNRIKSAAGSIASAIEGAIPGSGLIKSAVGGVLGLVSRETGGFIPGVGPQLIIGHGGEYVLSLPQLAELRAASSATTGGPTPVQDLGFSIAPSAGSSVASTGPGNQFVYAPVITTSGVDPASIPALVEQKIQEGFDDFVAEVQGQTLATGRTG